MRSLLWSEWRSKRLWVLALLASLVVPELLGDPLTFWGRYTYGGLQDQGFEFTQSLIPCAILALLFGAVAFAGELGPGVQDFLMSRPVSWKKLLAAKLIVGLGMLIATGLVAAIVFRLKCPAPYLPFATFARLSWGFALIIMVMAVPYLLGAACSVALPGVIGSILTMLMIGVLAGCEIALTQKLAPYNNLFANIGGASWAIGAVVAAVVMLRFGVTLSVAQRIRRYAVVVLGCVVALSAAGLVIGQRTPWIITFHDYNFSPDLSSALVRVQSDTYSVPYGSPDWQTVEPIHSYERSYFWRASDGLKRDLPSAQYYFATRDFPWLDSNVCFFTQSSVWREPGQVGPTPAISGPDANDRKLVQIRPASLTIMRLSKSGTLQVKRVPVEFDMFVGPNDFISPDGKIAAFIAHDNPRTPANERRHRFLDIKQGRWLDFTAPEEPFIRAWWQTNRDYAWLDGYDRLHTIRVR